MRKYIRKLWLRNSLTIGFIIFFFIIGISVGKAWALGSQPTQKLSMRNEPYDVYIRARPATSTTTTTTTTVAPIVARSQPRVPEPVLVPQGDWVAQCHRWAEQAGIVLSDSAIKLIERESHCNPNAQNPSSSACGIAQNIRGCNSVGYGYDPVAQLVWMHDYVMGRYGSWDNALAHSNKTGWY